MSKTINQIYRNTNKEKLNCKICNSILGLKCLKQPCVEYPNGLFIIKQCKKCNTPKIKKSKINRKNEYKNTFLTKLHQKLRTKLGLDELGFEYEQQVGHYRVDELNKEKKIIIEFNGDYVHANPKIYSSKTKIQLSNTTYTAKEKWIKDKNRISYFQNKGYKVLVIWQSDNLDEKLIELKLLLN